MNPPPYDPPHHPEPHDPEPRDGEPEDPADEFQGDTHAADIVGRTGEEMPVATHAEVHRPPDGRVFEARPPRRDSGD